MNTLRQSIRGLAVSVAGVGVLAGGGRVVPAPDLSLTNAGL